jgi:hypothetical protein
VSRSGGSSGGGGVNTDFATWDFDATAQLPAIYPNTFILDFTGEDPIASAGDSIVLAGARATIMAAGLYVVEFQVTATNPLVNVVLGTDESVPTEGSAPQVWGLSTAPVTLAGTAQPTLWHVLLVAAGDLPKACLGIVTLDADPGTFDVNYYVQRFS